MTSNQMFEFIVDKPARTVFITMQFPVNRSMVWDAFTKPELLDRWVAPKPWISRTKYMDFKVGGRRFYAMVSPEGEERWAIQEYTSITPKTNFKMFNAFADENEIPELPGSDWNHDFSELDGLTTVSISIYNESLERFENVLEGFRIGFAMSFENLKELLAGLSARD